MSCLSKTEAIHQCAERMTLDCMLLPDSMCLHWDFSSPCVSHHQQQKHQTKDFTLGTALRKGARQLEENLEESGTDQC